MMKRQFFKTLGIFMAVGMVVSGPGLSVNAEEPTTSVSSEQESAPSIEEIDNTQTTPSVNEDSNSEVNKEEIPENPSQEETENSKDSGDTLTSESVQNPEVVKESEDTQDAEDTQVLEDSASKLPAPSPAPLESGKEVTIKYIDQDGNEITMDNVSGKPINPVVKNPITENPSYWDMGYYVDIPGYEKVSADKYDAANPQTTIYYHYAALSPVVVKCVTENGDLLYGFQFGTKYRYGGEAYNVDYQTFQFPGYTLVKEANNKTGIFSSAATDVISVYKKDDTADTNFVSGNDSSVSWTPKSEFMQDSITLYTDQPYKIDIKDIPGKTIIGTAGNFEGITPPHGMVNFVYLISNEPVLVNYITSDGTKLQDEKVVGTVDEAKGLLPIGNYSISPEDIEGYHLVDTKGETSGTFDFYKHLVTFVYEKDEDPEKVEPNTPDEQPPVEEKTDVPDTNIPVTNEEQPPVKEKTQTTPPAVPVSENSTNTVITTDTVSTTTVSHTVKTGDRTSPASWIFFAGISFIAIIGALLSKKFRKHN